MSGIGGQASGDFLLSYGALRILYKSFSNTVPELTPDSFTVSNPGVVTAHKSDVLDTTPKNGVLGGSVAFTRPDIGDNYVGPAVLISSAYSSTLVPVGIFVNDALGNSYENTPGTASNKGPFLQGPSAFGTRLYETKNQTGHGGTAGATLTYASGDKLYASVNGYLTNNFEDSYEAMAIRAASGTPHWYECTVMGIVLSAPDSTNTEMFVLGK